MEGLMKAVETIEKMYLECLHTTYDGEKVDAVEDESSITFGKESREALGQSYKVIDPTNRIIYNPVRKFSIFQVLGHFLWVMNGDNKLENVAYYNPKAAPLSDDGKTHRAAYGERLIHCGGCHSTKNGLNQIEAVVAKLKEDPQTRRAIATIYDPNLDSTIMDTHDFPCTLGYQFLIRNGKLDMVCFMRSQNVLFVMPYDTFLNTMLQEYVARRVGLEIGDYYHMGSSFHIFEKDVKFAEAVIDSHVTNGLAMERMPDDVDNGLKYVLGYEKRIRESTKKGKYLKIWQEEIDHHGTYWGDMIRMLLLHSVEKLISEASVDLPQGDDLIEITENLHVSYKKALEIL
jgi:thymidylate synthase